MSSETITSKKRLLILASTYPRWADDHEPGFIHELARRLSDQFEICVIAPHAPGALRTEFLNEINIYRFRYAPRKLETLINDGGIMTNLKRHLWKWLLMPSFIAGLMFAARQQLKKFKPDVVHAHWMIPQGLVMALLSFTSKIPPFLVTSHGADLFTLRAPPFIALKRFVARRAAAMTVVSDAMVEELGRLGIDRDKVTVQPMGVDMQSRFVPDASVKRSEHEILFVGRLVEKKGLRYLIDALPQVLKHHPDVFLTIAGYGPHEKTLRRHSDYLSLSDKVNFLGAIKQDQLPSLYRRAALFVAPFVEAASGDREGLGLVTVEAIGCGCPVIVSDLSTTRYAVPLATRRVPPGDPSALADAINTLLSQPIEELRKDDAFLREMGRDRFDWQHVARRYSDILFETMSADADYR